MISNNQIILFKNTIYSYRHYSITHIFVIEYFDNNLEDIYLRMLNHPGDKMMVGIENKC